MLIDKDRITTPDISLLKGLSLEVRRDKTLYAQLADELRTLVDTHFNDGELFFSEKTLVSQLPVSQITIRRALHELTNEGLIMPGRGRGTMIRKQAISKPHTEANPSTIADRGGRRVKRIVGVLLPGTLFDLSEHSFELMHEFKKQGDVRDIEVCFHDTSNMARVSKLFRSVSGHHEEEAFILHTHSDVTHMIYHALDNRGYSSIAMEGVSSDYPGRVVATDAALAVRIGMDYLTGLGHSQIVLLVNEPFSEFNVQDKVASFNAYIVEKNIHATCRVVMCDNVLGGDSYEAAYDHMHEAFKDGSTRPTAIFTVSDPGAWAALKWCSQNNIKVPQHVSVLGYENSLSSQYMYPAISSVAHPNAQLVKLAYDILWAKHSSDRKLLIPPKLVVRDSTSSPS